MIIERVRTLNGSAQKAMSAALLAAALIMAYGWIVSPHVAYLHAVQKYEPAVQNIAAHKNSVCTSLGANRRQLETLNGELDTLRVKFFTPGQATAFLSNLETLAENTGCAVTSVDFLFDNSTLRKEESGAPLTMALHRAKLSVLGQYDDLIELFERLQHRSQGVWIDSCWIELADVRTGKLKCDVSLAIWVLAHEEDTTDE